MLHMRFKTKQLHISGQDLRITRRLFSFHPKLLSELASPKEDLGTLSWEGGWAVGPAGQLAILFNLLNSTQQIVC